MRSELPVNASNDEENAAHGGWMGNKYIELIISEFREMQAYIYLQIDRHHRKR